MRSEEWRVIPGYPDYSVSNHGQVRRDTSWKHGNATFPMRSWLRRGYPTVNLSRRGTKKAFFIHRLVALAFLGPAPDGRNEVNHKNCIKADNRPENLEWCSNRENIDHSTRMGRCPTGTAHGSRTHPERLVRGDSHPRSKLTEAAVREIRKAIAGGVSRTTIAERFCVHQTTISSIALGRTWRGVI